MPQTLVPAEGLLVRGLMAAHGADHALPQLLQLGQIMDSFLVTSAQDRLGEFLITHTTGELGGFLEFREIFRVFLFNVFSQSEQSFKLFVTITTSFFEAVLDLELLHMLGVGDTNMLVEVGEAIR